MNRALMIQGTGSGVGKSIIVAGLCRIFRDKGVNVAPFKAQNMALNSFITKEGGEIGRAQAYQAEAARIVPSVDMNPVLLKATGEAGCQVILDGKVHRNMRADEYYAYKEHTWKTVTDAYARLCRRHDLIIIEGAGSPAEINLADAEVVNMSVARHAQAPVILVGDIDKGGVFASLCGTIALLDGDADYIKAFVINKFRGDLEILRPGLAMIEERTKRPVLGVIPYLGDLGLHEEDGIPLERLWWSEKGAARGPKIKIVVVRLRYISNFTDFDPFLYEQDVELVYSLREADIEHADMVVIPGSKNTVQDLLFLRETGIEESIKRAAAKGIPVAGICGGYQMLGKKIVDHHGIESSHREVPGMGLLDVETVLERTKITCQIEAEPVRSSVFGVWSDGETQLKGYEIHMGRTEGDAGLFQVRRLGPCSELRTLDSELIQDGSARGNVWGTYIHGIFDNDRFRRGIINRLRTTRGLAEISGVTDFAAARDRALDRWAEVLAKNLDMQLIEKLVQ
ncbi:MAG: cobyric acid synthase [Nitrospiraceae bacterium]|nr:cobyric acid synthase [Nitrospiraceae bacterium]